jgi:exopolysaccharide biosynthesis polyprenyl glycosylphosphotransferase
MIANRRQLLANVFKLFDLVLMVLSFAAATLPDLIGNGGTSFAEFFSMRVKVRNFVIFAGMVVAWHIIFSVYGLYRSKRLSGLRSELVDVTKATSLGTLVICVASVLFRIRMATPLFLVLFWIVSTCLTVSSRMVLRSMLHRIRARGLNLRSILIFGTNPRAIEFARKIERKPELGYQVIGFADTEWNGRDGFSKTGYPLVCDLESFPQFLRENVVDEVVLGLPIRSFYAESSRIASLCEEQGVLLRVPSELFNLKVARSKAEEFGGDFLITLYTGTSEGWPVVVKRVLDFSLSLILITLLLPAFLIAAILIKLTSSGPVFFVQHRVGLNKRRFSIYKFRTMVPDAEKKMAQLEELNELSGPVFKIKSDPRITPIGKFLRRTSIDELPQLLNVLKGDMSLVGPRPMAVRDFMGFNQDWQRRRFSVRPGITCLWQVNGRNGIPFEKWMELDMQYIDHWSLWLDFKILAKTIPAVLKGSGAA